MISSCAYVYMSYRVWQHVSNMTSLSPLCLLRVCTVFLPMILQTRVTFVSIDPKPVHVPHIFMHILLATWLSRKNYNLGFRSTHSCT